MSALRSLLLASIGFAAVAAGGVVLAEYSQRIGGLASTCLAVVVLAFFLVCTEDA